MSAGARYRRMRLLAFALGACAFMLAFFHRVAPGAIAADLRASFDASAVALGFIAAFYFYPYAAMQLPSGVLADSIGPRRLFTAGSLVAGAGSLLFAFAPGVGWLLVGRLLVGLGVAVAFISVLKLIASWYSEREFGTWVGVLQLLGNLGAVLAAWPLAWLVEHVSWRSVFAFAGSVSLVLAAAIWMGVRDSPREAGLPSPHGEHDFAPRRGQGRWFAGLAEVAASRRTWMAFAMHFGVVGSYLTFSGLWAVPFLTDALGHSRRDATLHVTVAILGFGFGSLAVGAASDRMGRRRRLLRALALVYVACWTPWVLGWRLPYGASLAAFALMGIGISGVLLAWAIAKEINPPQLSGTATSLVNTGGFLGTALLQPAVGWILDLSTTLPPAEAYRRAALLLVLVAAAGAVAAFRLPETYARNVVTRG